MFLGEDGLAATPTTTTPGGVSSKSDDLGSPTHEVELAQD